MNDEEKEEYVKEHLLEEALDSMAKYGRYWNGSISRTLAPTLCKLIIEAGYQIQMSEIPPNWEHVYYPQSDSELVDKIAYKRAAIINHHNKYEDLPV